MKNQGILISLLLACCLSSYVVAQQNSTKIAFGNGEHLAFTVSYHWGFIWLDAGLVAFNATKTREEGSDQWKFFSTGKSFRKFDWLFKVRDTFEVKTSETLFPIHFRRHTHEGGYIIFNDYHFNQHNNEVYTYSYETKKPPTRDTLKLENGATDVLTATYITRSMDFNLMNIGDTIPIPMILDDIVFSLPIVFLGKEIYTTPDKQRFRSIKFSVRLEEGTMFRAGEELFVWVTDDDNKLPLMIEAKITVGSIKVYLSSYQNLAHPLTSLVQ